MRRFSNFCFFFAVLCRCFCYTECLNDAKAPGDIIIGGLFPIHESVEAHVVNGRKEWTCNRFSVGRLAQSLMMVHAINEVNESGELGNITLGYHIVDSCGDVTTALKNTLAFMTLNNGDQQSSPPILAVIGDYYSEISIAVTRQLNLQSIPLISYGATSGILSDKTRFPSFLRTVPEDDHQAHALIELIKGQDWNWVGVVATDSDYGRYAVERLQNHATKHSICFAFVSFLPEFLADQSLESRINDTVQKILESQNVSVIVSFAKPQHMIDIFDGLLQSPGRSNKVWLASDNWSQASNVLNATRWTLADVGTIFGTTLKSGDPSKFKQFLQSLDVNQQKNNSFLIDFLNENKVSANDSKSVAIKELIERIYPYAVLSIQLAVRAVTQVVKDLCINTKCDISTLQPWQIRDALQGTLFSLDGKSYSFDKNGDLNTGYDIVLWKYISPPVLDVNYIVGQYDIDLQSLTFNSKSNHLFDSIRNVNSRCSRSCAPGERKISNTGQPVCCYECRKCSSNEFSNTTDALECDKCNTTYQYSGEGAAVCHKKDTEFMEWRDPYHNVLLAFTSLGVLLTLIVGIIFLARWNTPVVRSSVGPISILLLLSLLSTFGSVVLFGAEPKDWKCKARQVVFGLSFTFSVSCILVKSFKIILAFEFDPNTKDILNKLYKPYLIIPLCMVGQVVICIFWLVYKPPKEDLKILEKQRLWYCDETLPEAFGAMLAYIGMIGIICFIVAFKGRKLPECYNDAKFITFSMLIYFIAWLIFGPVYLNVTGKYLPAVEMIVILFSAYGILFCLFFTKCYIILFKCEANTEVSFRRQVRNYSLERDQKTEGTWIPPSNASDGIANPALSMESLSNPEPSELLTDTPLESLP